MDTRITELWRSFRQLAQGTPGFEVVRAVGLAAFSGLPVQAPEERFEPELGFHVRLQSRRNGTAVNLHIASDGATLTTWPDAGVRWAEAGPIREHLDLRLAQGFCWGSGRCYRGADALAKALLAYAREKLLFCSGEVDLAHAGQRSSSIWLPLSALRARMPARLGWHLPGEPGAGYD